MDKVIFKEILALANKMGKISANDIVKFIPYFLNQNIKNNDDSGTREALQILRELEKMGALKRGIGSGFSQIYIPVVGQDEVIEKIEHANDAILISSGKKKETFSLLRGYLKKELYDYSIFIICLQGNIGVIPLVEEAINGFQGDFDVTLLLGPTPPSLIAFSKIRIAVVGSVFGSEKEKKDYVTLSSSNLSDVDIYISEILSDKNKRHVFIGDFLDNILTQQTIDTISSYYSNLINRLRVNNCIAILLIQKELHSFQKIGLIKRYADVVVDLQEKSIGDRILFQVRFSNYVDGIYSDWIPYRGKLGFGGKG
jgi:hypothetical protein